MGKTSSFMCYTNRLVCLLVQLQYCARRNVMCPVLYYKRINRLQVNFGVKVVTGDYSKGHTHTATDMTSDGGKEC
jgi:hypothetical protein